MLIPFYTNKERSQTYIRRLKMWGEKTFNGEQHLGIVRAFPINRKHDTVLILDDSGLYSYRYNCRLAYGDKKLNGKIAQVVRRIDKTNMAYHSTPHGDNFDLELRIDGFERERIFVGAKSIVDDNYDPPFLFLPHPNELRSFKSFLGRFSKKPEDLARKLDEYYAGLKVV